MTAHSVLNVRAAPEWGNSELYRYYERNGLGYGTVQHINNIYHKISEIQQQLPHPTQHMNTGDVIQINTPEFDPDIDGRSPMKEHGEIQGSDSSIQHLLKESKKNEAPALP